MKLAEKQGIERGSGSGYDLFRLEFVGYYDRRLSNLFFN